MNLQSLSTLARVQAARARIHERDDETVREQMEIASIASPTGGEEERGRYLRGRFEELGLAGVRCDEAGNVVGALEGEVAGRAARPVAIAAHLDTVFPVETPLDRRREGSRVYTPGITDNARGLAAMLAVLRALRDCGIRPRHPILFAGTVGEEGSGDLRGVKHLFAPGGALRAASAFIALDGAGLRRIVHRAIGARRLRAEVTGPGGHSWADWGTANPIAAIADAVAAVRAIPRPAVPLTTLTATRVGGGTSVNAIPSDAWLEIDIRNEVNAVLESVEREVRTALERACEEENGRRQGGAPLALRIVTIGDRPCGETPADAPLVQAAVAATRLLGVRPELVASSTDANVPIARGVPAITLGAGGESGGIHTTEEWYENEGGPRGIERALLTGLAASGIAEA